MAIFMTNSHYTKERLINATKIATSIEQLKLGTRRQLNIVLSKNWGGSCHGDDDKKCNDIDGYKLHAMHYNEESTLLNGN